MRKLVVPALVVLSALYVAPQAFAQQNAAAPTFNKDVAPIFFANCTSLPSARRHCADVAAHLQGRASVGEGDREQGCRRHDAAVARRSELRHLRRCAWAERRAQGDDRQVGRGRCARRQGVRICRRPPSIPTSGTSARPTRCCRCRRTIRFRPPGRFRTNTWWSRRTSLRIASLPTGRFGPATVVPCTTCSSICWRRRKWLRRK